MSPSKAAFTCSGSSVAQEMDSKVKKASAPGHQNQSDTDKGEFSTGEIQERDVQWQILEKLKKVNTRLDVVESQVADVAATRKKDKKKLKLSTGLETVNKYNKKDDKSSDSTDSSDNEVILPDLAHIRSSKSIQKQIDQSIARLSKKQVEGYE